MKIIRSTKCSIKFATQKKKDRLALILKEYGRVVNIFINYLWDNPTIDKYKILKPVVDISNTWFSARMRKVAAVEALELVEQVRKSFKSKQERLISNIVEKQRKIKSLKPDTKKNRRKINNLYCKIKKTRMKLAMRGPHKPIHKGKIAYLKNSKNTKEFDAWLHLWCIGNWDYAYWLNKVESNCQDNRVSFRTVNSYKTSQICPICSHTNIKNRVGLIFKCQKCGCFGNADCTAALNIKNRFLTGKYGSCYKPENFMGNTVKV